MISTSGHLISKFPEVRFHRTRICNHSSQVYSLYEIRREDNERVNNTAAYDKQYLEGRYGADPYLQNMLSGVSGFEPKTSEKK